MRAVLTDEQELLRDTVSQLAAERSRPFVEHVLQGSTAPPPEASLAELRELGLTTIGADPSAGDDGALGAVEVALVCESLGRALSPVPYLGTAVLPAALLAAAPGAAERLAAVAGDAPVAVALGARLADVATVSPTVHSTAVDTAGASSALVRTADGLAVAALAPATPADRDPMRQIAAASAITAPAGLGRSPVAEWRTLPRVALCADMVGAMAGALDLALDHARTRVQFGRPIGTFQAVHQICAAQHVEIEASRSVTYHAAWSFDRRSASEAEVAARRALVYVSAAARRVTEAAIQVHGGIGITWESPPHLHLRRVLFDGSLLGPRGALLAAESRRFAPSRFKDPDSDGHLVDV